MSLEQRWAFEEYSVFPFLLNGVLCHTSPQPNLLRVSPPTSTQSAAVPASGQICLPSFSWVVSAHTAVTHYSPNSPEKKVLKTAFPHFSCLLQGHVPWAFLCHLVLYLTSQYPCSKTFWRVSKAKSRFWASLSGVWPQINMTSPRLET